MTGWEIFLICVAFWLYMARISMRWEIELDEVAFNLSTIMLHLCFWFVMLPLMIKERSRKADWHMNERTVRLIVGESRWHKRERLAREHTNRARDLGMPEV